jgi:predicted ATPase
MAATQTLQGTARSNAVGLELGFAGTDYGYAIELGLPAPSHSQFAGDPESRKSVGRANAFAIRTGRNVRIRAESGEWLQFGQLDPFDSMMTHCSDPRDAMDLLVLRERMRDWRFYDHLRTDRDAPARCLQIGTYTPIMASGGWDLAAAA